MERTEYEVQKPKNVGVSIFDLRDRDRVKGEAKSTADYVLSAFSLKGA